MAKYLDEVGLELLWEKIKNKIEQGVNAFHNNTIATSKDITSNSFISGKTFEENWDTYDGRPVKKTILVNSYEITYPKAEGTETYKLTPSSLELNYLFNTNQPVTINSSNEINENNVIGDFNGENDNKTNFKYKINLSSVENKDDILSTSDYATPVESIELYLKEWNDPRYKLNLVKKEVTASSDYTRNVEGTQLDFDKINADGTLNIFTSGTETATASKTFEKKSAEFKLTCPWNKENLFVICTTSDVNPFTDENGTFIPKLILPENQKIKVNGTKINKDTKIEVGTILDVSECKGFGAKADKLYYWIATTDANASKRIAYDDNINTIASTVATKDNLEWTGFTCKSFDDASIRDEKGVLQTSSQNEGKANTPYRTKTIYIAKLSVPSTFSKYLCFKK